MILAAPELTIVIVDEYSDMAYPVPEGSCIPPAGDQYNTEKVLSLVSATEAARGNGPESPLDEMAIDVRAAPMDCQVADDVGSDPPVQELE